ncbi:MAG: PQQ-binding-like beta-propeller repeat protein [Planctomycetota bacterium]|jgi:outer membrane protein assembly factor BamB
MFMSQTITRHGIGITLIGILVAATAAFAAGREFSWPQFHGPDRDNISAETGLLKKWPDEGPTLIWTANELGHGFSSLSIAAGRIYTAGNIEKDTVITSLDLNGKVLWRASNDAAWTKDYPGTRSTPTIDGARVYHQSPLGNIVCLKAKTGEIVWETNILKKVGSKNSRWALAESLLIDGDHVISCPGGPETCMVAMDKNTGSVVWKAPSTGELAGYSSPILAEHQGLRIIMTLTAKAIIGVNADSGELLWHIEHESYADENIMAPIFHDDCVFISTLAAGSVKWKINVEDGKASLEELWRTKEMDNHHGGVILLDGNLYGTSTVTNGKLWVCLDWQTGQNKSMNKGVGKGSLTYADGMLYTLSIDRVMGLVRPAPTGFELVSSFEIPRGGKGKSWAHPVVCGGRLYIRHGEFLYAYNVR